MGILTTFGRPYVEFDPGQRSHREWLHQFLATASWGHCPVRFTVNQEGEHLAVIQRRLLEWYMDREFARRGATG